MLKATSIKKIPTILFVFCLTIISIKSNAQNAVQWVDNTYEKMSLDERVGQLFMIAAYSGTDKYNEKEIKKLIEDQYIGGLIFMQGTATKQAQLTNQYQKLSKTPLLLAMDAEWGLGMRLKGIKDLPKQMFLGATRNEELMTRYGKAVAAQCQRLGVHVNFAPVIDVNNNPQNPVINSRSFGEDKELVSNMGIAYMKALQENGVMACAKHFPGHGDTDVDSHKDLPQINKSKSELEKTEFYPFQQLIKNGIQSMMIAHLNIPSLEPQKNLPTTLSEKVVTDLLRGEMNYNGLIFTDALNMKGVTKFYEPGEVDYLAFKAGNDVLLFSENVQRGAERIKQALIEKEISESQLERSVKKILMAKYKAKLTEFTPIETENIDQDINSLTSAIRMQTAQKGITLLSDPHNVIDKIRKKSSNKIAYVFVGTSNNKNISSKISKLKLGNIFYAQTATAAQIKSTKAKLAKYDAVVVGVHNMSRHASKKYGLDFGERKAIKEFAKNNNTLTVLFGNAYAVEQIDNDGGFMVCYNEHDETVETALSILNSQTSAYGKLPVGVTNKYKLGAGIKSETTTLGQKIIPLDKDSELAKRFVERKNKTDVTVYRPNGGSQVSVTCCVSPNSVGARQEYLSKVDALVQKGIRDHAYPGCRIMAVKDGKVFYDRSFGYQTYNKKMPIDDNTIYDLASVTKTAATTMAVMKLYEQGKIDLNATLGKYLPKARGTNKRNVKIKNLLLHQGGLHAWIPFYKETLDDNGYPRKDIYQTRPSATYNVKVINGLYMNRNWVDTMWTRIYDSKLTNLGRYKYSDLDFIFLQKVVERVSGMSLDQYVSTNFYSPLGMKDTKYNPRMRPNQKPIAPSEFDNYFRHKKVQGYVHDMGAAMFGGVSGHAGLFSTPKDLSILMQMLMNGGEYNGRRYLKASTIKLFTARNSFISRRGLGFDKPQSNLKKAQPTSTNCSLKTFGHTGFTGTCVWADPVNNIQFIFLSNRTYPSSKYNKLSRMNIREDAQQLIYKAFGISR